MHSFMSLLSHCTSPECRFLLLAISQLLIKIVRYITPNVLIWRSFTRKNSLVLPHVKS